MLEGQTVVIPTDIGLSVPGHSSGHFNPHTHDTNGVLHIGEGGPAGLTSEVRLVRLGDFFDVWREKGGLAGNNANSRFNSTHIMDRTADATHVVRMFVNSQLNTQFEQYTPHDEDEILIRYDAIPSAPGGLVLATASDTGTSNSDRKTNATLWQILVSGVTAGATVELRNGSTVLGQATASGTTVTVACAVGSLSDGLVNLIAVQTTIGLTSPISPALAVTLDRTAPQFALAPRAALAGQSYSFDVVSMDEGQSGFGYSLLAGPVGASITASNGLVSWSPANANIGRHTLTVRAVDAAGNTRDVSGSLYAVPAALPWRNPVNSMDVDGDSNVFPVDVLIMINRINNVGDGALPTPTTADASPPFYDVTGDNLLAPIDVLQVINFLNRQTGGEASGSGEGSGSGELMAAFNLFRPPLAVVKVDDGAVLNAVETRDPSPLPLQPATCLPLSTEPAAPLELLPTTVATGQASPDDDWDSLLDLLAVDQLQSFKR